MTQPKHANRTTFPLMTTYLAGTQHEMGLQHGAMTRAVGGWEPTLEFYPKLAQLEIGGASAMMRTAVTPVVEAALMRMSRARPHELRDRSEAFMTALGVSPRQERTLLVMDVLQNIVNTAGRLRIGPFAKQLREQAIPACSSLVTWGAASDDGTLRHARNFDFAGVGVWEAVPEVVWCTPSDGMRYAFVTMRGGDIPGVTAFNEAGLVVTTHTRFNERIDTRGIGVIDLMHTLVRKAQTLDEVEELLRRRPVASSWGLCISSRRDGCAATFEVCGKLLRRVDPEGGEQFLAATNRYVHPDLKAQEVTLSPAFVSNSDGRYNVLRTHARRGGLSTQDLQRLLGSNEDSEVPGGMRASGGVLAQLLSVHSVVVEPEAEKLHFSIGPVPTGKGPWVELDWAWQDTPGFKVTRHDRDAEQLPTHVQGHFDEGAGAEALTAFVEAAAVHMRHKEPWRAQLLLERAVQIAPDAPSFRLIAGGARLRKGDFDGAMEHFEAGLEFERSPFYQGQLLLWSSRAAQHAGRTQAAAALRRDLLKLKHPLLREHHAAASREMTDAIPAKSLLKTRMNYHLVDLQV